MNVYSQCSYKILIAIHFSKDFFSIILIKHYKKHLNVFFAVKSCIIYTGQSGCSIPEPHRHQRWCLSGLAWSWYSQLTLSRPWGHQLQTGNWDGGKSIPHKVTATGICFQATSVIDLPTTHWSTLNQHISKSLSGILLLWYIQLQGMLSWRHFLLILPLANVMWPYWWLFDHHSHVVDRNAFQFQCVLRYHVQGRSGWVLSESDSSFCKWKEDWWSLCFKIWPISFSLPAAAALNR